MSNQKPLTDHQWNQINSLLDQVDRVAAILQGNREMGIDVPDLDVLGSTQVWAEKQEPDPTVETYFRLKNGQAQEMTVLLPGKKLVRYGSPSVGKLRDLSIYDKLPFGSNRAMEAGPDQFDIETRLVDNVPKAEVPRRLRGNDRTRHRDEIQSLRKAHRLVNQWMSWLGAYLRALESSTSINTTGVSGRDEALYVMGQGRSLKAIRPGGTVLQIGEALYDPESEEERAIRDRVEELAE
ncbi:hypothetical protein [Salinibacter ruber]|uniref:hypothetical protein n=1 Tax=Salinibacter ruber TaxID=146919 RepID=UPI0011AF2B1C|nr:hypothetical protein [Salinibacter ruber]